MRSISILLASLFFCISSTQLAYSQNSLETRIDSLESFINENYRTNWTAIPDSARLLLEVAIEANNRQSEANANKFLGVYYYRTSNQDSSIYFYSKAAAINKELGNTLELAKNTLNIGLSHRDLGNFEKTIENSLEAARYFEEVQDFKGISIVYNMVGSVYYYQNRLVEAEKYMRLYLENAKKAEDVYEIVSANQNLGAILSASNKMDEAIYYLIAAKEGHRKNGNKLGEATNSINLGNIFYDRQEYRESLPYFEDAYVVAKQLNNTRILLESIINLIGAYSNLDRNNEALKLSTEGIEIARKSKDEYMEMKIFEKRASTYSKISDYENAYIALTNFQSLKDSIINTENLNNIAELQTLYETEKKEKQIIELEKDKALQELTIQQSRLVQSGLGALVVLIIIIGFLWQSKVKERELQYRVEQLEVEKEIQAERERISRDLHDNVGAQLVNIISGLDLVERYKQTSNIEKSDSLLYSLKDDAQNSIGQLRDTIWALKTEGETPESLIVHLKSYLDKVEKISEISTSLNVEELSEVSLTPTQSLNVFRVVQEAIQNTIKHADATTLKIYTQRVSSNIELIIEDNGHFKESTADNGTHSGLGNMEKRAKAVGGTLTLNKSNSGTQIILSLKA